MLERSDVRLTRHKIQIEDVELEALRCDTGEAGVTASSSAFRSA